MTLDPRDLVAHKRAGKPLSEEQIDAFVSGYVAGEVTEAQAAALLSAIFVLGMESAELDHWTRAMLHSGTQLRWDLERPVVDKHSTGGVGDKASLVLAPALAACGVAVPMISGRGLGHTGGTLDKLESIPGLSTELGVNELKRIVKQVGCVIAAQTKDLVPADRGLYALRDATGLVEALPLIASSILSKKLAEGLDALVLDVKFGDGAFLPDVAQGEELARTMLAIAERFGLSARVLHTSMEQPLGHAVGHALEVDECWQVMRAEGPEDLRELVLSLGAELLDAVRFVRDLEQGRELVAASLADGRAAEVFVAMVEALGGDADPLSWPRARQVDLMTSPASGVLDLTSCRAIGRAVVALGGGRKGAGDRIDPRVGVRWMRRIGDVVRAGDLVAEIHHEGLGLEAARAELEGALAFDTGREPAPLVRARYG